MSIEPGTGIVKAQNSELSGFGGRDEIKELAERLKRMMPNAQKFTDPEAQAVAQVAVIHDLDCFNGEVWGLKNSNTGEWYGVMVGIKGLRKSARREARKENSTYWLDTPRLVKAEEYGVKTPGSIAYEIDLRDTATTQAWSKAVHDLTSAGIPYKEAVAMMGGAAPKVTGVGIADPSERSKMGLHARAKKRAEAEALKIRYSLEFRGASISVDEDVQVSGGELPEESFSDGTAYAVEEVKRTEEELLADIYGDVPQAAPVPVQQQTKLTPRPTTFDGLANPKALVDAGICESIQQAITALNVTKMAGKPMSEAEPVLREYMKDKK